MKAKDTVMKDELIPAIEKVLKKYRESWGNAQNIDYRNFVAHELRTLIAQRQAQISFKAGIEEVLKAIHYEPNACAFYVRPEEWQAKLKEWSIGD